MAIVERITFQIPYDKWGELWELERKIDEIEMGRHGAPPKRCYRPLYGGSGWDTYIIEREWESMAALEATMKKVWNDPDMKTYSTSPRPVYANGVQELYTLLDQPSELQSK